MDQGNLGVKHVRPFNKFDILYDILNFIADFFFFKLELLIVSVISL